MKFHSWMNKYQKSYSDEEYSLRFKTFKQNVIKVDAMNMKSRSAKFAINKYADLSADEFKKYVRCFVFVFILKYLGTKSFTPDPSWPVLPGNFISYVY